MPANGTSSHFQGLLLIEYAKLSFNFFSNTINKYRIYENFTMPIKIKFDKTLSEFSFFLSDGSVFRLDVNNDGNANALEEQDIQLAKKKIIYIA